MVLGREGSLKSKTVLLPGLLPRCAGDLPSPSSYSDLFSKAMKLLTSSCLSSFLSSYLRFQTFNNILAKGFLWPDQLYEPMEALNTSFLVKCYWTKCWINGSSWSYMNCWTYLALPAGWEATFRSQVHPCLGSGLEEFPCVKRLEPTGIYDILSKDLIEFSQNSPRDS